MSSRPTGPAPAAFRSSPRTASSSARGCTARPTSEVAVVFGHGFTGSQHNRKVVAFAQHLAEHGLAVYTADFRGHGESGGLSTLATARSTTSRRSSRWRGPATPGS